MTADRWEGRQPLKRRRLELTPELSGVFQQHPRPAALVERDGRALRLNLGLQAIVGTHFAMNEGFLQPLRPEELSLQQRSIEAACLAARGVPSDPFLVSDSLKQKQLIGRALSISVEQNDEPAVLLCFAVPGQRNDEIGLLVLQLLGLTQAEARLALLVGSGVSPRESAETLGIAESTARSVLRTIFNKLSFSRQAELANLVARLQAT